MFQKAIGSFSLVYALAFCIALASPSYLTARDDLEENEKWSTSVLRDFLEGVITCPRNEAVVGLLTPELCKVYGNSAELFFYFAAYNSYSIVSHQSSPDKKEMIFRVKLVRRDINDSVTSRVLLVRVIRQASGSWSVRHFSLEPNRNSKSN